MEARMNYVQERLLGRAIAPAVPDMSPAIAGPARQTAASAIGRISGDAVNMLPRPGGDMMTGGAMNMISRLLAIVQQLLSSFGLGLQPQTPQSYFTNATASSTGDPHLAFDGTDGHGSARHAHFDSMHGHSDLLDSSSFAGGYHISTQVTQPRANGVTYNRAATVSTNFGNTQISLDKDGNAGITSNGRTLSIASGQSIDLGNGETVTRNADGSLLVTDDNGMGGRITTRLSENGSGVDVNIDAQQVDLGGDLVSAGQPLDPRRRL
jgi:hypothetical protein